MNLTGFGYNKFQTECVSSYIKFTIGTLSVFSSKKKYSTTVKHDASENVESNES
jgi:hypothetical protein